MKKQGVSRPWFFGLIISLAIFFLLSYIWKAVKSSGYFRVKKIVYKNIDDAKRVNLFHLLGEDIFSIDLRKEAGLILGSFPQYCRINLAKVLPGRIFVDFIRRKPVASLSGYRNFALDENGVLFYLSEEPGNLGLPLISGLENKLSYPKPGQRCNFKEAVLVLDIIKAAGVNKVVKNFKLKKIEVISPLSATAVFLRQDSALPVLFEVRLGGGNIEVKFNILADLITQEKANLNRIEYFDLRFEEPVVKLKDTVGR